MQGRVVVVGMSLVVVYLVLLLASAFETTDCWSGYQVIHALKSLHTAQEHFRSTDADKNGKADYWRRDVAGLYALEVDGSPLQFINRTTALADPNPAIPVADPFIRDSLQIAISSTRPRPHCGWWIRPMSLRKEAEPDPHRYAFCAWPDRPDLEWVFIVNHEGIVFGKRLEPPLPPAFFPEHPPAAGWLTIHEIRTVRWRQRQLLWWVQFWRDY